MIRFLALMGFVMAQMAFTGCGRIGQSGGIVDNGEKPTEATLPDSNSGANRPGKPEATGSSMPTDQRVFPVLTDYIVDALPGWQAADIAEATILNFESDSIKFVSGTTMCDGVERSKYGVDIASCSTTETSLAVAGAFIRAEHSVRDDAITQVLRSFRQRSDR